MDLTKHLKKIAYTELEIGAVLAGAVVTQRFLDDSKIFKAAYASNPTWFQGNRTGAPFYIKWSGGIKAVGALGIVSYVKNPWIKLLFMGVALQGTLQQLRILTYDTQHSQYRMDSIGRNETTPELDAELKRLANEYRVNGPTYTNGPEYMGNNPLGDRYNSGVAGNNPLGDRYNSGVAGMAGIYDADKVFSLRSSDFSTVGF